MRFFQYLLILAWSFYPVVSVAMPTQLNYQLAAKTEAGLWKAYYAKDLKEILILSTTFLELTFGVNSPAVAQKFAFAFERFARMPQDAPQADYDKLVLPLLIEAYQALKDATKDTWQVNTVAATDLSWMIARRNLATLDPEIVANKMKDYYVALYGQDNNHLIRAAYLRSVAARYRDQTQDAWGGTQATDWDIIQNILVSAYWELSQGITKQTVTAKK